MTTVQKQEDISEMRIMNLLLSKFINSSINISPAALLYLTKYCINNEEIEKFINKISFSEGFGSYVTIESIKQLIEPKISNISQKSNELPQNPITNNNDAEIQELLKNPIPTELNSKFEQPLTTFSPNITKPPVITPKITSPPILPKKIRRRKDEDDEDNIGLEDEEESEENVELDEFETVNSNIDAQTLAKIREEKRKAWENLHLRSSNNRFKPIASEYPANFKILKDPNGKLFSQGSIEEFLSLQIDKFDKLKGILKNRPESKSLIDIGMINRLESSSDVQFIGMVIDKHQTGSKNFIITLEDPTGICSILVKQDSKELLETVEKILPDHVLLIEGFLRINSDNNSRIIIAKTITFPDVPSTHHIQYPEEDLAVCCISDIHFGSKEWLDKVWFRFIDYINCRIGNEEQIKQAGKIKYITIAGDLVDGIGVFPNQEKRLAILDINDQYDAAAKYFEAIPDYITIIFSPGDHDSVRKAVPTPAVSNEIAKNLYNKGVKLVGCPAVVSLHGIKTQIFHGTSLIDMNMSVPGLSNEDPKGTMIELIKARHLAPSYGRKTEIAPAEQDWLVMDPIPDILHTGHLHKNGCGFYKNILAVNSGCFQKQTDYMRSFGIDPDYGKPTIVNLKGSRLTPRVIDLIIEGEEL